LRRLAVALRRARAPATILDGLAADAREIVVAEGRELAALQMRASRPEALFDFAAEMGAKLAEQRAAGPRGGAPEPEKVNT
jgi:dehydrogenase/reductase SDR family member 7B